MAGAISETCSDIDMESVDTASCWMASIARLESTAAVQLCLSVCKPAKPVHRHTHKDYVETARVPGPVHVRPILVIAIKVVETAMVPGVNLRGLYHLGHKDLSRHSS